MQVSQNRNWSVVLSLSVILFFITFEISSVAIVLPALSQNLQIPFSEAQWVINSYLLSFLFFVVLSGRLGDLLNRRRMVVCGIFSFVIASFLTGMSTSFWFIICSRILQGTSVAMVAPNARALAANSFPSKDRGMALGISTSMIALGSAMGPLLGGFLAFELNWRWIFLINVPVGLVCLIILHFFLRRVEVDNVSVKNVKSNLKLDILTAVALGFSIFCIVFAFDLIDQIDKYKWLFGFLLLGSCVFLFVFILMERKTKKPLFDLLLLKEKEISFGCLIRFLLAIVSMGLFVTMALYLQKGLGYNSLHAGLIFLPMTLIMAVLSPITGKMIDRIGAAWPLIIGMIFFLIALIGFSFVNLHSSLYFLITFFICAGLGSGLYSPGVISVIMFAAPKSKMSLVSSLFSVANLIGSAFGVAFLGVLIGLCAKPTTQQTLLVALPLMMKIFAGFVVLCIVLAIFKLVTPEKGRVSS